MIVCTGGSLIDCIVTEKGSAQVADDISLSMGGEALNESIVLARLGEEAVLSAPVGHDFAGEAIRGKLRAEGVHLLSDYQGKTPVSILTVDSRGERKSRVSRAHDLPGFLPELPEDKRPAFVTMASLFRPPFLDPQACFTFAENVKKCGAGLLADTKLPKGTDPKLDSYRATLELLDFITPNELESEHYTGCSNPVEAAKIFQSYGVSNVIIKLGPKGCYCLPESGNGFYGPAFSVDCVDGIGAGDAFNAGLIYSLAHGAELEDAIRFASACGAVSTTARGAVAGIKSAKQIGDFLKQKAPTTCRKQSRFC
ncbi:MAG: carbohydrate kinase family protein [Eubacterium sp.]|nr:carbohydrate kinase family protein [Eubacterium sp.]